MPSFRWLVLFLALSLQKSYAADSCEPKSMIMHLVKTCYTGDMADVGSFGVYKDAQYAEGNGVNFCYNTIAYLSRDGGRTKVEVVHENASGELRSNKYNFDSKNTLASDKTIVVLKDMEAKCFAIDPRNDNCSSGFFGLSSNNMPMALTLGVGGDGFKLDGYSTDRNLIKEASSRGIKATGDFDKLQTLNRVLGDVRARIIAKSKSLLEPKNIKTAKYANYRACVGEMNQTFAYLQQNEPNMKIADPYTKDDGVLLGKVAGTYGWNSNNSNQVPTPGVPASNITGGKK